MIDKINRIFAALVRVHWILYWFVFCIAGLIIFHLSPLPKTRLDFLNKGVVFLVISPSLFITCWSYLIFYTKEEKKQFVNKMSRVGIPSTDTYFYTKISSDTDTSKKLFGYLYVLTKIIAWGGFGYIMGIGFYSQFILGK